MHTLLRIIAIGTAFLLPVAIAAQTYLPPELQTLLRAPYAIPVIVLAQVILFRILLKASMRNVPDTTETGAAQPPDWEDVQRSKNEFMTMAAHQLRTPLTSMRWNIEALETAKLPAAARKNVAEIQAGADTMLRIINELLDAATIEMKGAYAERKDVKIEGVIRAVLEEMAGDISRRKLDVTVTVDASAVVATDEKLLRLLVENLISNTVKYTPPKGRIQITLDRRPEGNVLSVFNSGEGIPPEKQALLFQKHLPARSATQYEAEGFEGIGLYIIKSVADRLGWQVWFDSQKDKGVTFFVLMPGTSQA